VTRRNARAELRRERLIRQRGEAVAPSQSARERPLCTSGR
jgi:hypothetical protein